MMQHAVARLLFGGRQEYSVVGAGGNTQLDFKRSLTDGRQAAATCKRGRGALCPRLFY